jgi:hypothetical protein
MLSLILATGLLTGSLNPDVPTQILKKEAGDGYTFYKLSFSGHTYIYFRYISNSAGNAFIHDPDCGCVNRALEKIMEK